MASWDSASSTPNLKFEHSPAESFLSAPGDMYPSLFESHAESNTVTPLEIMTPQSFSDDQKPDISALSALSPIAEATEAESTPAPEKKQVKKRKSWGQVLPEPKTSLPPRKRAKTEDEKEQRRVERVLRNRRAAQSSRERKRQEVEALEKRNQELENMVRQMQNTNVRLLEELQKIRHDAGVVTPLRPNGVTFSQELFSSQDGHTQVMVPGSLADLLSKVSSNTTVNPASLSPALTPVPEDEDGDEPAAVATPLADDDAVDVTSPDATQHPAVMLCDDLQCRSAEASRSWLATSQQPLTPAPAPFLQLQCLLIFTSTLLSACQRPLVQIAMSLKANFSLPPTPSILNTILWLVTTPETSPRRAPTSTSTNSSTTSSASSLPPSLTSSTMASSPADAQSPTRRSSNLRLTFLKKILTCSPNLARPLMDATMAALRLASSKERDVAWAWHGEDATAAGASAGVWAWRLPHGRSGKDATWLGGMAPLPSKEVLITLAWALKVEERKIRARSRISSVPLKLRRRSVLGSAKIANPS